VRVPTHQDGSSLYWEFATDNYDIGFGVYFEWVISDSNNVTIQVEEFDDDEGDIETSPAADKNNDVEAGEETKISRNSKKTAIDEIIPGIL